MNWEQPGSSRSPGVGRSPTSHKRRSMVKCESCRKKRIKVGDLVLPMAHLIQAYYFVVAYCNRASLRPLGFDSSTSNSLLSLKLPLETFQGCGTGLLTWFYARR